jgi:hypothetical protein
MPSQVGTIWPAIKAIVTMPGWRPEVHNGMDPLLSCIPRRFVNIDGHNDGLCSEPRLLSIVQRRRDHSLVRHLHQHSI